MQFGIYDNENCFVVLSDHIPDNSSFMVSQSDQNAHFLIFSYDISFLFSAIFSLEVMIGQILWNYG